MKATLFKSNFFIFFLFLSFFFYTCKKEPATIVDTGTLSHLPHDPQSYELVNPTFFTAMVIPADNPMTVEGIELGRHLFYDPILSSDSTISCGSCHQLEKAFTDGLAFSPGVNGTLGKRSSMSLANIGYSTQGLFWDGRVQTLEEQVLHPVEDPLEMNEVWENVEEKLRTHDTYPAMFRAAFPINHKNEITKDLVAKSIAQFERTLISAESRYDFGVNGGEPLTDQEVDGYLLFSQDFVTQGHPGCFHCHDFPVLGGYEYFNNGIEEVATLEDFPDLGLGAVTGNIFDNGKMKAPSLRNIELTAPYMHDGRFETLEEVIDHYASGGHYADNLSPDINVFSISDEEKNALIAFLKSLTDTSFINNPAYQNPFE